MGWRVKRNDFGAVARALPDAIDGAVQDMGGDLGDVLKERGWKRTGTAVSTIEVRDKGVHAVEVAFGWYLGRGFYTGFQEDGTVHQAPRPVVRPAAHEAEPIFAAYVEKAVKRASEAR